MGFGLDGLIASYVKPHLTEFFVDFTDENFSFGGTSVTMHHMQLKPELLEKFGLPFTLYGTLGDLAANLSFDWYLTPTLTVDISDVYLLIVPSSGAPFDAVKEAEKLISGKRKEVADYFAAELAKALAEETPDDGGGGGGMLAGFITGLINSIKVNISNIHVRYEDAVTRPAHPYSAGLVLKSLTAESRDPDYNEGTSPTIDTFYKLVKLEGLGTYWNSNTTVIGAVGGETSTAAIDAANDELKKLVEDDSPLNYFVGPVGATLKAMVTLKPERLEEPFSLPKVDATLEIDGLQVGVTNLQYTDLAILGDSIETMNRSRPYRKYRPTVPVKGNAKQWWTFAHDCVMIPIKRRHQDWSWTRMKEHKKTKLEYAEEYFKLLQQGDAPSDEQKEVVQKLEDALDNFSVILARKEMDAKWKVQSAFVKDKEASGGGWWGKVEVTPEEIEEFMKDNFDEEQRKKIFHTVHYDPNAGPPPEPPKHPRDYVEIKFGLRVPSVGVHLSLLGSDAKKADEGPRVVELAISAVDVGFQMLPAVSGIKLTTTIGGLNVFGDNSGGDDKRAKLVRSINGSGDGADGKWLSLLFETNPLDSTASKKVVVKKETLEVAYDAVTIQKIMDCLALPGDVHLTNLKAAAKSAAKKAGAMQAARLKAALANNTDSMDLDIRLNAPYVLIPEGGLLTPNANVLVLHLGVLDIQCRPRNTEEEAMKIIDTLATDTEPEQIPTEIAAVAYNQIEIKLSQTQVTLANPGEPLADVMAQKYDRSLQIDQPTPLLRAGDLVVNFDQSAISGDPRFPKMKAKIHLPIIDVSIVDARLLQLLRLLTTLPLPKAGGAGAGPEGVGVAPDPHPEAAVDLGSVDFDAIVPAEGEGAGTIAGGDPEKAVQLTDFALELNVDKLHLGLWSVVPNSEDASSARPIRPVIDLNVDNFGVEFKLRSFGMSADVKLVNITATYPSAASAATEPVYLLRTGPGEATEADLANPFVHVHFYAMNADCPPAFAQEVRSKAEINVAHLHLGLHQESLQVIMGIVDAIGKQLALSARAKPIPQPPLTLSIRTETETLVGSDGSRSSVTRFTSVEVREYDPNEVLMQLVANLSGLTVQIVSDTRRIAELKIAAVAVGFEDRHHVTSIAAELLSLEVNNLDQESIYGQILRLDEFSKMIHAQVILHKDPPGVKPRGDHLPQTEVVFVMGAPTVTVVGSFLGNLLGFASSLTTPAAKRAALEGAKVASGKAAEAARIAAKYANDARIKLDITLEGPHILIPKDDGDKSRNGTEALLTHFGTLRLKNALNKIKTGSTGQRDAVVDQMTIGLSGVKASRVLLAADCKTIVSESYLLAPVELKVDLSRNLSSNWYKEIPKIKVGGELHPALVAASSDDILLILTSLMNLANGLASGKSAAEVGDIPEPAPIPDAPPPAVANAPNAASLAAAALTSGRGRGPKGRALPVQRVKPGRGAGGASGRPAETILVNLSADFTVHKLEFNMYSDTTPLDGQTGLVGRNPEHTLGHLETNSIVTSARLWANDNIEAKVVIQDLIIDDTRAELPYGSMKKFLVRVTDPKTDPATAAGPAADDPILAADFKLTNLDPVTGLKSINVNMKSTALELIVNMEYINLITSYASSIVNNIPRPRKKVVAAGAAVASAALEEAKVLAIAAARAGPPKVPPLVDANVNVAGIRLVVLENPASTETNALLLTLNAAYLMKTDDGASKGDGALNLGVHTAKYDGSTAQFVPITQIVEPTVFGLAAVIDPRKGTELDLTASDLRVHFSAGTLLLISKVVTALGAAAKSGKKAAKDGHPQTLHVEEEVELEDNSKVWKVMSNYDQGYAFLEEVTPAGEEGADAPGAPGAPAIAAPTPRLIERVSFKSGVISLSIEVGSGAMATPLLLIESHVSLEAKDWTSNLSATGALDVVVAYNNNSVGVWEYILETVEEKEHHGFEGLKRKPWEIKFNLNKPPAPRPLSINLSAPNFLELTITKTAMRVIMTVASAFGVAAKGIGASEADVDTAPFVLKNFIGSPLTVNVADTAFFTVVNDKRVDGASAGAIPVEHGGTARFGLEFGGIGSIAAAATADLPRTMQISVPAYGFNEKVDVSWETIRYFPLEGQPFGLLIAIETKNGSTYVVLRGAVQMENELTLPVDIYTQGKLDDDGTRSLVGTVKPGKFISLPVTTALTSFEGFVFKTAGHEFTPALPVAKVLVPSEIPEALVGKPEAEGYQPFALQASWTAADVVAGNTEDVAVAKGTEPAPKSYRIKLKTPLVINNLLTTPLTIVAGGVTTVLEPGAGFNVTNMEPGGWKKNEYKFQAKIAEFEGKAWSADIAINKYTDLLNEAMFTDEKSERYLYFKFERTELGGGAAVINFYAPYWMVNHTELDLGYRTKSYTFETAHPGEEPGPRMFAYDYYGTKNTCEMRIGGASGDGAWGTGVNLDAAGLPTGYIAKVGEREYHFTIEVSLTGNKLTKMVTIAPRYTATNICPFPVTLKEVDTDSSVVLAPNTATPYWPYGKEQKFTLAAGSGGALTAAMFQDRSGDSLLRLDNERGGVRAKVHVKETKATIVISEFGPGEVPLLYVNDTYGLTLTFAEVEPAPEGKGADPLKVKPGESVLHTWSRPEAAAAGISWTPDVLAIAGVGEMPEPTTPTVMNELKDESGILELGGQTYHWSSFTNGIQRTILFTEREEVVRQLEENASAKAAPPTLELSLLLDGIGLNLVNNMEGRDVLYLRVSSTDVIWESKGPKEARYAILDDNFTMILEHGYQNYVNGADPAARAGGPSQLDGGVEIDFKDFSMTKPEVKTLRRRPYQAGVALNFKTFPLGMEVSLQVSKLQIDSQDPAAADDMKHVFAVVPQKGVAGTDTDAAPSIIIVSYRKMQASAASAVQLVSGDIILQEFKVAANMGLIDDIVEIVVPGDEGADTSTAAPIADIYELDYAAASEPTATRYASIVKAAAAANTITVFESFKIYTLKFYLTFTVAGGRTGTNPLKVLIMGLGAILANVTNVHFEVSGFQVVRMRMSNEELVDEIVSHYIRGIISNIYLLVLKLDVLGNPFKLVMGLGTGLASLLADPVMGAMDGRFIGGVANGVQGLLDGTVGNLTDSLSKITGCLGKGLEALHLRGVSDLVNVLSWTLGGVSSLTHKAEPKVERMRPPRAILPAEPLEPYSHDLNIVNAMERQVKEAYKTAAPGPPGKLVDFFLMKDHLFMIHENMALSLLIYPETLGAPSYTWAHAWKEFSGVSLDPTKPEVVVFSLASKGWGFGATVLPIPTSGPEMAKWLQAKADAALKAAPK